MRLVFAVGTALVVLALIGCSGSPLQQPQPESRIERSRISVPLDELTEVVGQLSEHRDLAEQVVSFLKQNEQCIKENGFGENFDQAVELYNEAQVKFNWWIAEAQTQFSVARSTEIPAKYQQRLQEASDKSEEFRSKASMPCVPQFSIGVIAPLLSLGLTIWALFMASDAEERDRVIEQVNQLLENQKWRLFAEIPPTGTSSSTPQYRE